MKCLKCGYENVEGVNFCSKCGISMNMINNDEEVELLEVNTKITSSTKKKSRLLFILPIFVVFGIAGFIFVANNYKKDDNKINNRVDKSDSLIDEDENKYDNPQEITEFNTMFNNYNIEMSTYTEAGEITIKQQYNGVVDELNQKEYLEINTITNGSIKMNLDTKMYSDFVTGYSYTTNPYAEGSWIKEKKAVQMVNLKEMLERISTMNDVKIVNNHFKIKITKKELKKIIDQTDSDYIKLNDYIYVDAYIKNNYIAKLYYDFSEAISEADKFTITIKFSNYDKAGDVEIPEKVIKNAR